HADGGGEAPPLVRAALRSPGRPLDASTRSFMETRFGHDFGHVRVHTDPLAAESARSVKALAYAVGHHMIFAQGSYAPASQAGRKIIAHELVHQLQQGASAGTHLQRFTESLEGWVGGFDDDSAMEVNLRYKVFDSTGQAIFNSEFTG